MGSPTLLVAGALQLRTDLHIASEGPQTSGLAPFSKTALQSEHRPKKRPRPQGFHPNEVVGEPVVFFPVAPYLSDRRYSRQPIPQVESMRPMKVIDPEDAPRRPMHDEIAVSDDRVIRSNLDTSIEKLLGICRRGVHGRELTDIWTVASGDESNPCSRLCD